MPVGQHEGVDELLSVLANANRRAVISVLRKQRDATTVDDLAAEICEECADRIRTELRHTHLPKMASADLVVYDADAGTVETTDRIREVQPVLDAVRDLERDRRPWMFGVAFEPTIRSQQAMAEYCMESFERQLQSLEG